VHFFCVTVGFPPSSFSLWVVFLRFVLSPISLNPSRLIFCLIQNFFPWGSMPAHPIPPLYHEVVPLFSLFCFATRHLSQHPEISIYRSPPFSGLFRTRGFPPSPSAPSLGFLFPPLVGFVSPSKLSCGLRPLPSRAIFPIRDRRIFWMV